VLSSAGTALDKGDRGGPGAGETAGGLITTGTEGYVRITAKPGKKAQAPAEYVVRWSSSVGGPPAARPDDPLPPEE
jgi:hypothetical protein